MTDTKPVFASKTVWGALVAIAASLAGLAGFTLAEGDQAELIDLLAQGATLIGAAIALYGRISATKQLHR